MMAAIPESAEAEVRRLRKELANERADCAVAIEALTQARSLLEEDRPPATTTHRVYRFLCQSLAKLGASK